MLTPPARQLTLPALDKRWNNGNERFLVPPDVFDPKRYRVDAVAQRDAKAYILQHHYKCYVWKRVAVPDILGRVAQVRDDEADAWEQLPGVPLHLGDNPTRMRPTRRLVRKLL